MYYKYRDKFALEVELSYNCPAFLYPLIFHLYLYMACNPIIATDIKI